MNIFVSSKSEIMSRRFKKQKKNDNNDIKIEELKFPDNPIKCIALSRYPRKIIWNPTVRKFLYHITKYNKQVTDPT